MKKAMKKLVRKGECNHCGECCEGCGYHTVERCSIWRTAEQPTWCRNFPNHPRCISQHSDNCSYRFYDSETGIEITKKKHKNIEGNWECDWKELDSYALLKDDC